MKYQAFYLMLMLVFILALVGKPSTGDLFELQTPFYLDPLCTVEHYGETVTFIDCKEA